MPNGLPAIFIAVIDYPETGFGKTEFQGDFCGNPIDMTNQFHISVVNVKGCSNMLAGNNQQMVRSMRMEITKNEH
jgi:hypothetical protein